MITNFQASKYKIVAVDLEIRHGELEDYYPESPDMTIDNVESSPKPHDYIVVETRCIHLHVYSLDGISKKSVAYPWNNYRVNSRRG